MLKSVKACTNIMRAERRTTLFLPAGDYDAENERMNTILSLNGITKDYHGVTVLRDISIPFIAGEVHALVGENGAGKTTLIKSITGAIQPSSGMITMEGVSYSHMTPCLSSKLGIGAIYQEFSLVPSMSIAENIFLGKRVSNKVIIDYELLYQKTEQVLGSLGIYLDPKIPVSCLSTAQQQIVEIAKAISRNARILIMDEPSAAIAVSEVERMFEIIALLKQQGVTVIYISHRLEEIFNIADRVSVLRDGNHIATLDIHQTNRKDLIQLMVGRELSENSIWCARKHGEPVLELRDVCGNGDTGINLTLHRGEILGLAGLVGAGRTELAKLIFGAAKMESGTISVNGQLRHIRSPRQAINLGIGLIPEDRKTEGAFLEHSIEWNITCMCLKSLSRFTVLQTKKMAKVGEQYIRSLQIKCVSAEQLVKFLSGGNQQKVVLAKVLAAQLEILLFDEPTRGIDVGAKQEIYKLMNELADQGKSIIMISSDMEEIMGMSDRMLVMHEGRIAGELTRERFDQTLILEYASGEAEE